MGFVRHIHTFQRHLLKRQFSRNSFKSLQSDLTLITNWDRQSTHAIPEFDVCSGVAFDDLTILHPKNLRVWITLHNAFETRSLSIHHCNVFQRLQISIKNVFLWQLRRLFQMIWTHCDVHWWVFWWTLLLWVYNRWCTCTRTISIIYGIIWKIRIVFESFHGYHKSTQTILTTNHDWIQALNTFSHLFC